MIICKAVARPCTCLRCAFTSRGQLLSAPNVNSYARITALAACAVASSLAQDATERGALFISRGGDTLVVDRFIRSADRLEGSVQIKGQPRIDYVALLGPNDMVRALTAATAGFRGS